MAVIPPDKELLRLLECKQTWEETTPAVQSWARLEIHRAACEVLSLKTKEQRRTAIGRIPEQHRERVKEEVRRVWNYRKNQAQ